MTDKRYHVSGLFNLEVEGDCMRNARETAERILRDSGIEGKVIQVEEVRPIE
jgi:hypothetical protein